MKLTTLRILSTAIFCMLLTSCKFFGGENISMVSDEAINKIKELIKSNIDLANNKILFIRWEEETGEHKLENRLANIRVDYVDKEGNAYSQTYELNDKGEFEVGTPKNDTYKYSYDVATGINPDNLNGEKIRQQMTDGAALVGDEYELASVESYQIKEYTLNKDLEEKYKGWSDESKSEYGKQDTKFVINFTKIDEKSEQTGRMVTTNYYTYKFIVDADGKVQGEE